ncbi:hypothetical protein FA13DRAFT_1791815 [Coprinellus micaceus]|uniref:Uncharacterized protein n=1 Tax=Coprinellus micaceus TaxID=71717 RepID=A0A4Y7TAZ9_COPMI|nr:hypothetical protein FA13DRAFT_1791815 [Coprinellus micaceus]
MSLNTTPTLAPHQIIYEDIRATTRALAGSPPPSNYQGHQLIEIHLSYGEIIVSDIGRYGAKCVHPDHRDRSRYPNCYRTRMVSPPLPADRFEYLRIRIIRYCLLTNGPWGLAQSPTTAQSATVFDIDIGSIA